jgi:hypothetical protein
MDADRQKDRRIVKGKPDCHDCGELLARFISRAAFPKSSRGRTG